MREPSGQAVAEDGFSRPTNETLDVYVQSEINVQNPDPRPTGGSDDNDGLTKATPLLTIDGVRKMIGRRGIQGKRIVVHLAGGFLDDSVYPASDPWDGTCTEPRYYLTREVLCGGGEALYNSFIFRGPRNMLPVSTAILAGGPNLTVTDFGADGLRTKWTVSDDLGATDVLKGYWVRVRRGSVEVTQPLQITGNDSTHFWTDNGPNTPGADVFRITDTFTVVRAAAELNGSNSLVGDHAASDRVLYSGIGTHEVYGRFNQRNPPLMFERLWLEAFRGAYAVGLSFDVCHFYNTTIIRGGWCEFHNCIVDAQYGMELHCETRTESYESGQSETSEYNGRALIESEAPFPNGGDPLWPERGGVGLYVAGGGLRIGDTHTRGIFRVWKSLSVEGGIVVRGPGSALVQRPGVCILFSRNGGGAPGLWCRDGGMALIDDASGLVEMTNVTGQLKVGIGAAIALGTGAGAFREVGGWAGNFSRHLEVNGGGKPTGDFSRIADSGVWY